MTVTVTLNAALDHLILVEGLRLHDTNRIQGFQTDAGGKGINVSRMITELGGETVATGFLGGGAGAAVCHVLDAEGVPRDFVQTATETRTNVNVESADGPPTTFNARGGPVSNHEWQQLLDRCKSLFARADTVVLAGSLPTGVPEDAYAQIGNLAKEVGCFLVLDADGDALVSGLGAKPDMVKPNTKEAGRLLGRPVGETEQLAVEAARQVQTLSGAKVVALSRGSNGCVLVCPEGTFVGEGVKVTPRSTIGSGDSLVGGILVAKSKGLSWDECLRWGIVAGAATAVSDGTRIGTKAEFDELFPSAVVRRVS